MPLCIFVVALSSCVEPAKAIFPLVHDPWAGEVLGVLIVSKPRALDIGLMGPTDRRCITALEVGSQGA